MTDRLARGDRGFGLFQTRETREQAHDSRHFKKDLHPLRYRGYREFLTRALARSKNPDEGTESGRIHIRNCRCIHNQGMSGMVPGGLLKFE